MVVMPVLGLIAVVLLVRRGHLGAPAFVTAPRRNTGLGLGDLAVGLAMIVVLGLLLSPVATLLGLDRLPRESAHRMAAFAMLGQLVVLLPVVLYALARVSGKPAGLSSLGLTSHRPRRDLRLALWGLLLAIVLVQAITAMVMLVAAFFGHVPPPVGHDLLAALIETDSRVTALVILAAALALAPLFEEVIYRGLVQSALLEHFGIEARWLVILTSALLFGAVHAGPAAWHVLPGLVVLGVLLGWLYERTGSLLAPVLVHFGFNLVNVALALLLTGAAPETNAALGVLAVLGGLQ
jgi:membrane protease YdiL (CAAX protease family)